MCWPRRLLLAVLLFGAVRAEAQCVVSASGIAPEPYAPSAAHLAAVQSATSTIAPIAGKVGVTWIGMSNASGFIPSILALLRNRHDDAPVTHVDAAQYGKTSEYWADLTDSAWAQYGERLAKAKVTDAQVQAVFAFMTAEKQQPIPTPEWRFRAIADLLAARHPNLRLVTWITINGAPFDHATKPYAANIHANVRQEMTTLASSVEGPGWPVATALLDLWAGPTGEPNPYTASWSFLSGVSWDCGDFASDRVHLTVDGYDKGSVSIAERLVTSPIYRPWLVYDRP